MAPCGCCAKKRVSTAPVPLRRTASIISGQQNRKVTKPGGVVKKAPPGSAPIRPRGPAAGSRPNSGSVPLKPGAKPITDKKQPPEKKKATTPKSSEKSSKSAEKLSSNTPKQSPTSSNASTPSNPPTPRKNVPKHPPTREYLNALREGRPYQSVNVTVLDRDNGMLERRLAAVSIYPADQEPPKPILPLRSNSSGQYNESPISIQKSNSLTGLNSKQRQERSERQAQARSKEDVRAAAELTLESLHECQTVLGSLQVLAGNNLLTSVRPFFNDLETAITDLENYVNTN